MGTDVAEPVDEVVPSPSAIKVHNLMCTKLMKFVDRISQIFPQIEAARPRCSSGIQALCLLSLAIEKSNLLLQHCRESSKLYLALTGDVIMSRCERSRNMLERSLGQIQNMVPLNLAVEISHIVDDLRNATFVFDSSEEEVGRVLRALIQLNAPLSVSMEKSETEALQFTALRLHITSPKALLIEKKSVKKLYDKVEDSDPTNKKKILKYLLYLLKKYGTLMMKERAENDCDHLEGSFPFSNLSKSVEVESRAGRVQQDVAQTDMFSTHNPPPEFKCPISQRLMYDPVIIASGQTFERMWIQKWFDEGNDTCPKTKKKLPHLSLTPNTITKDMISRWCMKNRFTVTDPRAQHLREASSASIVSFGSSMNDIHFPASVNNVSIGFSDSSYVSNSSHVRIPDAFSLMTEQTNNADSIRCQTYADTDEINRKFLSELHLLPFESQRDVVEDVKKYLHYNDQAFHFVTAENFVEPLVRFLNEAYDLSDVNSQKAGSKLLLAFVDKNRNEIPCWPDQTFSLLENLLGSDVTEEALAIIAMLSTHKYCTSIIADSGILTSILKNLDSQTREYQESAIKVLQSVSSNSETRIKIRSSDFIPKLIPFMCDGALAKSCILILKNLCHTEEARASIAGTSGCIASIAGLLEIGSREDQEHAVSVLVSLCSQSVAYCQVVMEEGVIPALCNISINGNERGKMSAIELLRLLRDTSYSNVEESPEPIIVEFNDFNDHPKVKKSNSKASGFFGSKLSIFTKPISFTSRKKK